MSLLNGTYYVLRSTCIGCLRLHSRCPHEEETLKRLVGHGGADRTLYKLGLMAVYAEPRPCIQTFLSLLSENERGTHSNLSGTDAHNIDSVDPVPDSAHVFSQ